MRQQNAQVMELHQPRDAFPVDVETERMQTTEARTLVTHLMRKTYRLEVKRICRERLREFIKYGFTPGKLVCTRVLCFAGPEALEVFEVYNRLNIPHANIGCLERDRKFSNELRRRYLGIQIRQQTLDEFIALR